MKKKGRKCQWSETLVNDQVDIIVENGKYRQKLPMTNTKNAKNGQHLDCVVKEFKERCVDWGKVFPFDMIRPILEKFHRCVVACRAAALKLKTSSGIKRFQESKDYGEWFNNSGQLWMWTSNRNKCHKTPS